MSARSMTAAIAISAMTISWSGQSPGAPAKKHQARPPATQPFGKEAFTASRETTLRWIGNAGFLINSRAPRS